MVRVLVMHMLTHVLVLVEVDVQALVRGLAARDDLDAAVLHAARRPHAIGELLELLRRPLEDDHLEAVRGIEVHVHRRAHLRAEPVLQLDEALGEVANVMVVDERDGRDGVRALRATCARVTSARARSRSTSERVLPRFFTSASKARKSEPSMATPNRTRSSRLDTRESYTTARASVPRAYSAMRMSARPGCPGAPGEPFAPREPGEPFEPGEPPDAYCVCPL